MLITPCSINVDHHHIKIITKWSKGTRKKHAWSMTQCKQDEPRQKNFKPMVSFRYVARSAHWIRNTQNHCFRRLYKTFFWDHSSNRILNQHTSEILLSNSLSFYTPGKNMLASKKMLWILKTNLHTSENYRLSIFQPCFKSLLYRYPTYILAENKLHFQRSCDDITLFFVEFEALVFPFFRSVVT